MAPRFRVLPSFSCIILRLRRIGGLFYANAVPFGILLLKLLLSGLDTKTDSVFHEQENQADPVWGTEQVHAESPAIRVFNVDHECFHEIYGVVNCAGRVRIFLRDVIGQNQEDPHPPRGLQAGDRTIPANKRI